MCKNMYYTVYTCFIAYKEKTQVCICRYCARLRSKSLIFEYVRVWATLSFCFDKLFASALNMPLGIILQNHLFKSSFVNPFVRKGGP